MHNQAQFDRKAMLDSFRTAMTISDLLCTTATRAYMREHRNVATEHHTAVHTLTSALLAGQPTSTLSRESRIPIAESYSVLALSVPKRPSEHDSRLDATVVARRKLRRLLAALVPAKTAEIPGAVERAHELLDMVARLGSAAGLYHFNDLALEYQLTRPGPGRARFGELLTPLERTPELLETLRVHIANDMNRQRTAHLLHIHTNTVGYRLRRIAQITGLDPTAVSGLWQLRSAMIARSFDNTPSIELPATDTKRHHPTLARSA
ncbi:helix-turn-helix domain-containing protein [Nocardia sp. NPDC023988]|uniref:PucR family transcriptional regulator n=1 Tax=unclassified Nocardia TaxID=2637762 RepID=UPI00340A37E2